MDFRTSSRGLEVRFRREPHQGVRLDVDAKTIHRHLRAFREGPPQLGLGRSPSLPFRSREKYVANYLLFKHLAAISMYGPSDSLAEGLSKRFRQEKLQDTFTWRPGHSTVAVFEALCAMLEPTVFDGSSHLFEQLARFLVLHFHEMTEDDPEESARCLVALDRLQRDMADVVDELARGSAALEAVITELPIIVDYLSSPTRGQIQRRLGFPSRDRLRRHPHPLRRDRRFLPETPLRREGLLFRERSLLRESPFLGGQLRSRQGLGSYADDNFQLVSAPENGQFIQLNYEKQGWGGSTHLPLHRSRALLPRGLSNALLEYESDSSDEGLGILARPFGSRLRGGRQGDGDYLGLPLGRRNHLSGPSRAPGLLSF